MRVLFGLLPLALAIGPSAQVSAEEGVVIEHAWAQVHPADPNRLEAFLVLNNRTLNEVVVTGISSPLANSVGLVTSSGRTMPEARIPIHAELYMMPGGVRITFEGYTGDLGPGAVVPLQLAVEGSGTMLVEALIIAPSEPAPDHEALAH